ncbi:hypothetical protein ACRRTK_002805 [Alexandromys fortis]
MLEVLSLKTSFYGAQLASLSRAGVNSAVRAGSSFLFPLVPVLPIGLLKKTVLTLQLWGLDGDVCMTSRCSKTFIAVMGSLGTLTLETG